MEQKREKWFEQQGVFIVLAVTIIVLAVALVLNVQNEDASTRDMSQQEDIPTSNMDLERVNEESIRSVELLEVEVQNASTGVSKAVGTGVVYQVEEEGVWIATAAHVLRNKGDEDRIMLNLASVWLECTTWLEAESADLAYLYLPREDIVAELVMVPARTDKVSYDRVMAGDIVRASGYCEGTLADYAGVLTESWIYVEDFAQHMMVAECEVKHGMSGGALYDAEGRFLGMICGGNEDGELVAVPWHVMQARFEEIGQLMVNGEGSQN